MNNNLKDFIKRIIFPTVATILLFTITFFAFFIPRFEKVILDKKQETIKELTKNGISILDKYHRLHKQGKLSKKDAQNKAIEVIQSLRYGAENKDYFWITDLTPIMIMHPYRSDLNGTDVSNFKDRANQHPFLLFVDTATKKGAGYVRYMWQWKDNPRKIVPKMSYVEMYKPWRWVIGTGIYIEDVKEEINKISSHIITISLLITTIIALLLTYIIRQSKKIEEEKDKAEKALLQSREKYRAIVEAGREGISMVQGDNFIYVNHLTCSLLEYSADELRSVGFFQIFLHPADTKNSIRQGLKENPLNFEYQTKVMTKSKKILQLTLQISQITYTHQPAFVVAFKDSLSAMTQLDHHSNSDLMVTVKSLNRKLKSIARTPLVIDMHTSIQQTILMMKTHNENAILVQAKERVVGLVNEACLKKQILRPDRITEIFKLMHAPLNTLSEDATVFDAITTIKEKQLSHIITTGPQGEIQGIISLADIINNIELTFGVIVDRIKKAENIYELKSVYNEVHQLIYTLISSGSDGHQISTTLGEISDHIMTRVITLAHQNFGPAPSAYSFISLGSVARMEQTLFTDQDNAMILPDNTENDDYFQKFTTFINDSLHTIGYNRCPGDLMASIPKWRVPLKEWKNYFKEWIRNCQDNDLTATSIFFDMRLIQGNQILLNELRSFQIEQIANSQTFLRKLAHKAASAKIPTNIFGNVSENFDIKQLVRIIVDFVRVYSLKEEIHAQSTFERLNSLYQKSVFNKKTYESIKGSLELLTQLRLKHQCELILEGFPPDNEIKVTNLSDFEQASLKKVMGEINSLQTVLTNQFLQNS